MRARLCQQIKLLGLNLKSPGSAQGPFQEDRIQSLQRSVDQWVTNSDGHLTSCILHLFLCLQLGHISLALLQREPTHGQGHGAHRCRQAAS